ncbi:MAG: hypothetical protein U0V56_08150 [Actinomycetota bacterium]
MALSLYGFTGGRRQVAEDVAEAFARAIEHRSSIRELLLHLLTAFRLASRLQREKRPVPAVPDPAPGIADPLDVRWLARCARQLSPHHSAPRSCPRRGRVHRPGGWLGMSAATVRVHLFRGRRRCARC